MLVVLVAIPLSAAAEDSPEEKIRELEAALSAQRRAIAEQRQTLENERRRVAEQGRLLEEQQRALDSLRREIRGEDAEVATTPSAEADVPVPRPPTPRAPVVLPTPVAGADTPPQPPVVPTPPREAEEIPAPTTTVIAGPDGDDDASGTAPDSSEVADAERPKSERPIDQLLVEAGGILLPNGALQVEPGFEWTHFTDSAVAIAGLQIFNAILIGTISVDRLDRDIWSTNLTARYGLFERFQLEARLPFVARKDTEVIGVGTPDQFERDTTNYNVGDFEMTALYQPIIARNWIPNVVLNLRARFPTGEDPFGIPLDRYEDDETGESIVRLARPPTGSGFFGVAPGFTTV